VGRVGHRTKGRVISILKSSDAQQMEDLSHLLNFTFTDVEPPTAESLLSRTEDGAIDDSAIDYEKLRRAFEDTISLVDLAEEPLFDQASIEARANECSTIDNDDADEDDEEDFQ
jgi:hypothetical protein